MEIKYQVCFRRRSGKVLLELKGGTTGSWLSMILEGDPALRAWLLSAPGGLGETLREVVGALDAGRAVAQTQGAKVQSEQ